MHPPVRGWQSQVFKIIIGASSIGRLAGICKLHDEHIIGIAGTCTSTSVIWWMSWYLYRALKRFRIDGMMLPAIEENYSYWVDDGLYLLYRIAVDSMKAVLFFPGRAELGVYHLPSKPELARKGVTTQSFSIFSPFNSIQLAVKMVIGIILHYG